MPMKKRKEKGEQHVSMKHCNQYYKLVQDIAQLREKDTSWDEGIMEWAKTPDTCALEGTNGSAGVIDEGAEEMELRQNIHQVCYQGLNDEMTEGETVGLHGIPVQRAAL